MSDTDMYKLKRPVCLFFAMLMLFLCACNGNNVKTGVDALVRGENSLSAAVIYDSSCSDGSWEDTLGYLRQPLVLAVTAEGVDISGGGDISDYDLIYLDSSISLSAHAGDVREQVTSLVSAGSTAVLANELYSLFDADFIGAYGFEKLNEFPYGMTAIDAGEDLSHIQEIIGDFSFLYQNYPEFSADLASRDYGYMISCSTAQPIIGYGAYALYSANDYGDGCVIFTNPLLPNAFSISGFSMTAHCEEQAAFASTTASCNQLLINAFAEYAFMQRYGYSLSRTFGSFGGSNMAWELHYEEISAFENDSAIIFGELCREYDQIPSFTLIRSTYKWFLRQESVSYLLNQSSGGHEYRMDYNESAYSSGMHVAEGADDGSCWLALSAVDNGGSYFADYPEYDYRAAPAIYDLDGDGIADIVCGGMDGSLQFFRGKGYYDRLHTEERAALAAADGSPLAVPSGYSSPVISDFDGDGIADIISGSADGGVYLFRGLGGLSFSAAELICRIDGGVQVLPAFGDADGDGTDELVIGTGDGRILLLRSGGEAVDISANIENLPELGSWLSPTVYDYNGDGIADLVIGCFDGYIALRFGDGNGGFTDGGYISCSEKNYKGNSNLKFGNYCSPRFYDLDGDGADDLICGNLEYGMAVPIDSEYFPYSEELSEQLRYMQDNYFYCGVHFYTNAYASPEREDFELKAQLASRDFYGLDSSLIGANQHTWYTSTGSSAQSFISQWKNGICWNSGFISANAASIYPHQNAQNVIALPFFLEYDGRESILIQNNSTVLYTSDDFTSLSAKYGMPVCMYYHCDFAYQSEETARGFIESAERFRRENGYSFVGEDQLMKASAAAYNLTVSVSASGSVLTLTPGEKSRDGALYDESFQQSCGLRLRVSERFDPSCIRVSSNVVRRDGRTIYLSLDGPATVDFAACPADSRILSVNTPAAISLTDGDASLAFSEPGMMELIVSGSAEAVSSGWSREEFDGKTRFVKFGEAETLEIKY